MDKNRKPTSELSWIGIAAHEIRRNTRFTESEARERGGALWYSGAEAFELAQWLAGILVHKRNYDLLDCDPRTSTHEFWPANEQIAEIFDDSQRLKAWLGTAQHEVTLITGEKGKEARRLTIEVVGTAMGKDLPFRDQNPRETARSHFHELALAGA